MWKDKRVLPSLLSLNLIKTSRIKPFLEFNVNFQALLHSVDRSDTQQMAFEFVMSTDRAPPLWQTEVLLQGINDHLNKKVTSAFKYVPCDLYLKEKVATNAYGLLF